MLIKITDYNSVEIIDIDYKTEQVIFRWINSGEASRKHRARIRWTHSGEAGRPYFNSYNLKIALDLHQTEQYYIAAYTGGNGCEYTRIMSNSNNEYKPFKSKEQAQEYIDSGELDNYIYYPSHIIYTKIITAQEKEQYSPDYRRLWLPLNKYPKGPFEKSRV